VDIAATLEHLRDQRHLMVHTKVLSHCIGLSLFSAYNLTLSSHDDDDDDDMVLVVCAILRRRPSRGAEMTVSMLC